MVKGLVQGVGFRPFIFRLANSLNLKGMVDNRTSGVLIIVEGTEEKIAEFKQQIIKSAPPASQIKLLEVNTREFSGFKDFTIAPSINSGKQVTEISPDITVCPECLADIDNDPSRKDYPFVNCTNCGPRFTIIESLPYDRQTTSMKEFKMCPKCESEYLNINDRRFHAQPVACNNCGPHYTYEEENLKIKGTAEILSAVTCRIEKGESVALKGQGGYHLICDALNASAVAELRKRKQRDAKPFAIMFRDTEVLSEYCIADETGLNEITSWRRPVVILRQKKIMPDEINSGLGTIGAILPYMPFHYLLFRHLKTPAIVFTSGNISEEPVIKDDDAAKEILLPVTGALISYNREIVNRADDSVVRIAAGKIRIIRRSRGYVPSPVDLNFNANGILALGAEQKNTFCIGKDKQAIMSQHIGDLKNMPAYDFFKESIERFRRMFMFNPEIVACDLHPDYLSSVYAETLHRELSVPLVRVQHHHAHIASCMAENHLDEKVTGISYDGTGYGTDGNIWGGEFLIADLAGFERYSHFDYIPLPGGDRAVAEPWRTAFSYLYYYYGNSIDYGKIPGFRTLQKEKLDMVREIIDKKMNTPVSSAAGRLFDAVSAMLGLCKVTSFDSEAPMRLESVIKTETDDYYPFDFSATLNFGHAIKALLEETGKYEISYISAKFHNTIAMASLRVAEKIRSERSINKVILSGGVFQNKYLLEKTIELLARSGFEIFTNELVPANDGGIALGQLAVASKTR
ncbi:MAG: carbamoyltransferase HypF [Bacteroidales bacterium]